MCIICIFNIFLIAIRSIYVKSCESNFPEEHNRFFSVFIEKQFLFKKKKQFLMPINSLKMVEQFSKISLLSI